MKKIKSIKSGTISRTLALSKLTLKSGALAATEGLNALFRKDTNGRSRYLEKQAIVLTKELGQLKGSLMKAGQLLSTYGEHFLPPEALKVLKTLQFQSPSVAWSTLKKQLEKELGPEKFSQLEVNEEPLAAASLGQVHEATVKSTGERIVLKIQYPGLEKVIESDLAALKRLLGFVEFIPREGNFEHIFAEVRSMLEQELDYKKEAVHLKKVKQILIDSPEYIVPTVYDAFCTERILAMTAEDGLQVDSDEVLSWPAERRNRIGENYLRLYFRELLDFGLMQTDPHLGNYRIRANDNGIDQLVLFDYGAVREVPIEFLNKYQKMILGAFERSRPQLLEGAKKLGLIHGDDPLELIDNYVELCYLFTEPFAKKEWDVCPKSLMNEQGDYDWGQSDLPLRVSKMGKNILTSFRLRTPPQELVFLDRKMAGTFSFLAVLKVQINGRKILEEWIYDPPRLRG